MISNTYNNVMLSTSGKAITILLLVNRVTATREVSLQRLRRRLPSYDELERGWKCEFEKNRNSSYKGCGMMNPRSSDYCVACGSRKPQNQSKDLDESLLIAGYDNGGHSPEDMSRRTERVKAQNIQKVETKPTVSKADPSKLPENHFSNAKPFGTPQGPTPAVIRKGKLIVNREVQKVDIYTIGHPEQGKAFRIVNKEGEPLFRGTCKCTEWHVTQFDKLNWGRITIRDYPKNRKIFEELTGIAQIQSLKVVRSRQAEYIFCLEPKKITKKQTRRDQLSKNCRRQHKVKSVAQEEKSHDHTSKKEHRQKYDVANAGEWTCCGVWMGGSDKTCKKCGKEKGSSKNLYAQFGSMKKARNVRQKRSKEIDSKFQLNNLVCYDDAPVDDARLTISTSNFEETFTGECKIIKWDNPTGKGEVEIEINQHNRKMFRKLTESSSAFQQKIGFLYDPDKKGRERYSFYLL